MNFTQVSATILVLFTVFTTVACSNDSGSILPENLTTDPAQNDPFSSEQSIANASKNSLTYSGITRRLTHGIVESHGESDGHFQVDVDVSDSEYSIYFYTLFGYLYSYWYAVADTAEFSADLYSASTTELLPGTYEYVDIARIEDGTTTSGLSVFSKANVSWDFNGDGNADEDEEIDIVSGYVTIDFKSGNTADLTSLLLTWDVLLTDGQRSTGNYEGDFRRIE